jgi:type I restriction enzyme S subunit
VNELDPLVAKWPTRRALFLFREVNERGYDLPLASVTRDGGVEFRDDLSVSVWNPGEDVSGYKRVLPGDFVIGLRSFQSGLGYSSLEGLVSPAYSVLRPCSDDIHAGFFRYLLKSRPLISRLENIAQGIRQGRTISVHDFNQLRLPLPPIETQRTVVSYLDYQTGRIDNLINNQSQVLKLLDERIDATVKQAIQDSPLAGGRSVRLIQLKRVLRKLERPLIDGAQIVTAYRDGEVDSRMSRRVEGYTFASSEETYQGVCRGDVVIHGLDGFSGAIGVSNADGCCSPVYHVCLATEKNDPRYVARLLRVLALDGYLGSHSTSVRQRAVDLRNWDIVGAIWVPIPDVAEQANVAELIEALKPIRRATERFAVLLHERREAVIGAAVTGELDIPEAA